MLDGVEVGHAVGIVTGRRQDRAAAAQQVPATRPHVAAEARQQRGDARAQPAPRRAHHRARKRGPVGRAIGRLTAARCRARSAARHGCPKARPSPAAGSARSRSCALRRKLTATTSATCHARARATSCSQSKPGSAVARSMSFNQASFAPPDSPACTASCSSVSAGSSVSTSGPSSDTRRARANSSSMSMAKLLRTEARLIRCQCTSAEVPKRAAICTWPAHLAADHAPVAVQHVAAAFEQRGDGFAKHPPVDHEVEVAVRPHVVARVDHLRQHRPLHHHERNAGGVQRGRQRGELADHLHVVRYVEVVDGGQQRAQLGVERGQLARRQVEQVRHTVLGGSPPHRPRVGPCQHRLDAVRRRRPVVLDGASAQQLEQVGRPHVNLAIGSCPARPGGGPRPSRSAPPRRARPC